MTKEKYINTLPENEKDIIQQFRKVILENDTSVSEEFGKIMSVDHTLNYYQNGVFKYGLAVTTKHVSFHSMVLYANPELAEYLKKELGKVKFQKGCINFKSIVDFPIDIFTKHIKASSQIDFSPVIKHYKSRK